MCLCICIGVCVYVYMCVLMCVCVFVYVYVCVCSVCVYASACIQRQRTTRRSGFFPFHPFQVVRLTLFYPQNNQRVEEELGAICVKGCSGKLYPHDPTRASQWYCLRTWDSSSCFWGLAGYIYSNIQDGRLARQCAAQELSKK